MQIQLPVVKDPLISLLPRYAHPLSILLLNRQRNLPYLLSDFSRLAYDCEIRTLCNPEYDWMYTGCGALTYECGIFPISILKKPNVIINFISAMLQKGRYCIVDIDEFFCRFSSLYHAQHKISGVLVFGIDTFSNVLFISNYSENDGYQDYEIDIDEFLQAIEYPHPQLVVHCFRENKALPPPSFDQTTLFSLAQKYKSAALASGEQARYLFDSIALSAVVDRIRLGDVSPEWLINSMLSLREHKVIMLNRVLWLCDHNKIDNNLNSMYQTIYVLADETYSLSKQYERETQKPLTSPKMHGQSLDKKREHELLGDITQKLLCLIEQEKCFMDLVMTMIGEQEDNE